MLLESVRCDLFKRWEGPKVPRLSAAMTTPSLYLIAITEVPVTMGDCVCCVGPDCMYAWS
jgi:hypothetical protein